MEKSIDKTANPSIVDTFLKGCAKGFKIGIENITPAMILGYTSVSYTHLDVYKRQVLHGGGFPFH